MNSYSQQQIDKLEQTLTLKMAEILDKLIADAKHNGLSESEIIAQSEIIKAHLASELERIMPELVAVALDGYTAPPPKRVQ